MVTLNQIKLGVAEFIEKEIAIHATGLQKFGMYSLAFGIVNGQVTVIDNFLYSLDPQATTLIDNEKNIDLDGLYNMLKYAIQKSGKTNIYGIIVDETDVEKLYAYIKKIG